MAPPFLVLLVVYRGGTSVVHLASRARLVFRGRAYPLLGAGTFALSPARTQMLDDNRAIRDRAQSDLYRQHANASCIRGNGGISLVRSRHAALVRTGLSRGCANRRRTPGEMRCYLDYLASVPRWIPRLALWGQPAPVSRNREFFLPSIVAEVHCLFCSVDSSDMQGTLEPLVSRHMEYQKTTMQVKNHSISVLEVQEPHSLRVR